MNFFEKTVAFLLVAGVFNLVYSRNFHFYNETDKPVRVHMAYFSKIRFIDYTGRFPLLIYKDSQHGEDNEVIKPGEKNKIIYQRHTSWWDMPLVASRTEFNASFVDTKTVIPLAADGCTRDDESIVFGVDKNGKLTVVRKLYERGILENIQLMTKRTVQVCAGLLFLAIPLVAGCKKIPKFLPG
jgi:hypothetical protein